MSDENLPPPSSDQVAHAVMWVRLVLVALAGSGVELALLAMPALVQTAINGFDSVTLHDSVGGAMAIFVSLLLYVSGWQAAPWIARRLFDGVQPPVNPVRGGRNALAVAIVILGIWELQQAVVGFARTIGWYLINNRKYGPPTAATWHGLIEPAVRLLIGIWLVCGTGGIVRAISRHSGRFRDQSETDVPSA